MSTNNPKEASLLAKPTSTPTDSPKSGVSPRPLHPDNNKNNTLSVNPPPPPVGSNPPREQRSDSTKSNDKTPLLSARQPLTTTTLTSAAAATAANAAADDEIVNISNEEAEALKTESDQTRNSVSGRLQKIREYFFIDTNVQIGLEMLPPFGGKMMFYSWYFVLIAAIILQTNLNWQYQCNDVCGLDHCVLGKVNKVPTVTSQSCAKIQTISTSSFTHAPALYSNNINNNDENGGEENDENNDKPILHPSNNYGQSSPQHQDAIFSLYDDEQQKHQHQNENHHHHNEPSFLKKFFSSLLSPSSSGAPKISTTVYNREDDNDIMDDGAEEGNGGGNQFFYPNNNNNHGIIISQEITKKYCQNNNSDLPAGTNVTVCGVSWFGGFGAVLDNKLNRFFHLRFSMPRPHWENETAIELENTLSFSVKFVLALKNATAISDQGFSGNRVSTSVPISCRAEEIQCDGVTIPVIFGSVTNSSTFTLLAYDVPNLAYIAAINEGAVQAISQKSGYTIATIVFRYVFFVGTVISMMQLMYSRYTVWNHLKTEKEKKRRKKIRSIKLKAQLRAQRAKENPDPAALAAADNKDRLTDESESELNSELSNEQEDRREHLGEFEQNWALLLNFMLVLYMNPFFAVSVYVEPTPRFFIFLEYKIPLYFVITVVMCVLALCLATLETKPSYTMRIGLVLLFLLILILDLVDAGKKGWHFNTVECVNFECSSLRWAIIVIIVVCLLVIMVLLFYLHRNLAQLPYLATRPRQLSMRLMIFIFTAYVVYYVISTVTNLILFAHNDMLDQSHSELRIGTLMCAFTFVTIITTAFKFVLRTDRIPPHPSDLRWKKVAWTKQWYTWLNLHGGGAYVFFNEDEEEEFDVVQATGQHNVSDASDDSDFDRKSHNPDKAHAYRLTTNGSNSAEDTTTTFGGGAGYGSDNNSNNKPNSNNNVATTDDYQAFNDAYNSPSANDIDDPYAQMALGGSKNSGKKGHSRSASTGSISSRVFKRIESMASLDDQNMANFLKRPQQVIDKVEDFTLATAKLFKLVSAARQPFMNLESAIDCFNLAYEAYGVPFSKGDERIRTGITFQEAFDRTTNVTKKFVCCCLHADDQSDTDSQNNDPTSPDGARVSSSSQFNNYGNSTRPGRSPSGAPEFTGTFGNSYNTSKNKYSKAHKKDLLVTNDSIDIDPYGAAKLFSNQKERSKNNNNNNNNNNNTNTITNAAAAAAPSSYQAPAVSITSPSKTNLEGNVDSSKQDKSRRSSTQSNNNNGDQQAIIDNSSLHPSPSLLRTSMLSNASATSLAQVTNAAYGGKVPINTEQYGYTQLFVYENFDIQVVISEMDINCEQHKGKHPRFVIAFRGTNNQTNLRQDFRFTREVWREMQKELSFVNSLLEAKVHKGFLEQWMALQPAVLEKMAELVIAKPESRIYVTGHSMGGAVACLCGYTMVTRFRSMMIPHSSETGVKIADDLDTDRLIQVYTYGMPKLGDGVFREEYNKKVPYTFRIVNESDTVSGIGVFMGHHVGSEICIDRYGNFICNPMPVEKLFRPTQGRGVGLRHHSMYGYSASLNKIAAHTSLGNCPVRCLDPYVPELATALPVLSGGSFAESSGGNNKKSDSQNLNNSSSLSRDNSAEPTSARSNKQQQKTSTNDDRDKNNNSSGSDTGSVVKIGDN